MASDGIDPLHGDCHVSEVLIRIFAVAAMLPERLGSAVQREGLSRPSSAQDYCKDIV